jgi:hypothetical protein
MSIAVSCSQCGSQLRVKDELAGRRGKCPKCQGVIQIPSRSVSPPEDDELRLVDDDPPDPTNTLPRRQAAPSASSANIQSASLQSAPSRAQVTPAISAFPTRATPAPEIQLDQFLNPAAGATNGPPIGGALQSQISESEKRAILDALQGQITPVKTTGVYRMAMMFVALVMLLLPMVYLGLIFGVANLMYYHATNHTGIMAAKSGNGRDKAMLVVVYLLPLLAGVVLIAFMVKPLFARKAKAEKPRSLTRDREPLLFAFVERLLELSVRQSRSALMLIATLTPRPACGAGCSVCFKAKTWCSGLAYRWWLVWIYSSLLVCWHTSSAISLRAGGCG